MPELLALNENGLYCEAGNFYIDPWRSVERALITHAHGDHARWGSQRYLATKDAQHLMRARLGAQANIECMDYGESVSINSVRVSFHPAGHVLGSAQIRLEHRGEIWVVSGDYKTAPDPTCPPFEPIRCHTFISESTFGLPIYRWAQPEQTYAEINEWWRANQQAGKTSVLYAYALGKAQRILCGVDHTIGPIYTHGAVERINGAYRASEVDLPHTLSISQAAKDTPWHQALIIAPPSADGTPWLRRFGHIATGFASGWMRIRGARKQRRVDRGFVLSDHADWPGLLYAIGETKAERVWVTHGYTTEMVRWLCEQGYAARTIKTEFEGEGLEIGSDTDAETADINSSNLADDA